LAKYSKVYVIQPYREQEKCSPTCQNAIGHECQCSCMGLLRIPTKPAMHSNLKPAGSSDLKPATLGVIRMGRGDDVLRFVEGQAAG